MASKILSMAAFTAILTDLSGQSLKLVKHFSPAEHSVPYNIGRIGQFIQSNDDEGGSVFLYDTSGEQISKRSYESVSLYGSNCLYLVKAKLDNKLKYSFLDAFGMPKSSIWFDEVSPFQHGSGICKIKDTFYLVNELGNIQLIEGAYKSVKPSKADLLMALDRNGKWGIIDKTGKVKLPFLFSGINYTDNPDLLLVTMAEKSQQSALINIKNQYIIPFDKHDIYVFPHYIRVSLRPSPGDKPKESIYFDLTGNPISDIPQASQIDKTLPDCIYWENYSNGTVFGIMDPITKEKLTGLDFSSLKRANYGLLSFVRHNFGSNTSGFIQTNGQIKIEKQGFYGIQFSPCDFLNYAGHGALGQWYDENGNEIFPEYFRKLADHCYYDFQNLKDTTRVSVLAVSVKGIDFGLYSRKGNPITEEIYDTIGYINKSLLYFKNNGKYGLINHKGEEFTTVPFDKVKAISQNFSDFLYFDHQNKRGILAKNGRVVLPAVYRPNSIYVAENKLVWIAKEDGVYVYKLIL